MTKMKRQGCPMHSREAVEAWRRANLAPYARAVPSRPAPPPQLPPRPETAPAPVVGSGLDLADERAALARAQREGIELKNAVLRGTYAPVSMLAEVLATASQAVAERLDHLPGILKKACPQLTDADRGHVMSVIASARNEWVRATSELAVQRIASIDDEAEDVEADRG